MHIHVYVCVSCQKCLVMIMNTYIYINTHIYAYQCVCVCMYTCVYIIIIIIHFWQDFTGSPHFYHLHSSPFLFPSHHLWQVGLLSSLLLLCVAISDSVKWCLCMWTVWIVINCCGQAVDFCFNVWLFLQVQCDLTASYTEWFIAVMLILSEFPSCNSLAKACLDPCISM